MQSIDTDHLRLVPYTPADLLALIESEDVFAEQFGMRAAEGLRAFVIGDDVSDDWRAMLRDAEPDEADPFRFGFAVVHTEDDVVIGNVGFHGPPDEDGMVEIAYGIVPGYEGHGLGTEAAQAATDFACADEQVKRIRAHTKPERGASTRVLEKIGFERTGEVEDDDDGAVWRWERRDVTT